MNDGTITIYKKITCVLSRAPLDQNQVKYVDSSKELGKTIVGSLDLKFCTNT